MSWLAYVDPKFPGLWDQLAPYLEPALEHDEAKDWSLQDLRTGCEQGWLRAYALVDDGVLFGAGVCTDTLYPRRKVLTIVAMGATQGMEQAWRECFSQFCDLARAGGYAAVSATGRPGWLRKLNVTRTRTVWEIDV